VPLQTAIALGRSAASKTSAMIESVGGIAQEAPRPMKARSRISWSAVATRGVRTEPRPKMARPTISSSLRPNRSDSAPVTSSKPANTSV
jgi:hypothetical protein